MTPLWRSEDMMAVTGALYEGEPYSFSGLSTDSRTVAQGDLFVALQGPRVDGQTYLAQAQEKGATGALVSKLTSGLTIPQFVVDDTFKGLQTLARVARKRAKGRILALTGSYGKTTVKEALLYVLSQQTQGVLQGVHGTQRSFNNHWGSRSR